MLHYCYKRRSGRPTVVYVSALDELKSEADIQIVMKHRLYFDLFSVLKHYCTCHCGFVNTVVSAFPTKQSVIRFPAWAEIPFLLYLVFVL